MPAVDGNPPLAATSQGGESPKFSCDAKAGQLIISHAAADEAAQDLLGEIREERIEHVEYVENMHERLSQMELPAPNTMEYQLHLVGVPEGQENWKANYLQYRYTQHLRERVQKGPLSLAFAAALGRSDLHLIIQPNHLLRTTATAAAVAQPAIKAAAFRFSEYHQQYKSMLNVPAGPPAAAAQPVTIAVLDTGIADDSKPHMQVNFTDPQRTRIALDDHGHGTTMCMIIRDVAPFAQLRVFKVAAGDGFAVEWDVLAALCAIDRAHVVNISMSFGLHDFTCGCGKKSNLGRDVAFSEASRSAVFENHVRQATATGSIVVAAAGNAAKDALDYPARFDDVLAISAVTSRCERSSFSNYGSANAGGAPHSNRFAIPGGETKAPAEPIGGFGTAADNVAGTSHAAAYATGVVAHLYARALARQQGSAEVMAALHKSVDKRFPGYTPAEHGNGIPRL
jgi:subtilisin family serine protease